MATLEPAEDWSGGAANAQVSASTSSFDSMSAAGTAANAIHATDWVLPGAERSAKASGANYQYGRWLTASHTRHRRRFSYKFDTLPPAGTNRIIFQLKVGDGSTVAAQIRLDAAGKLAIRNVTAAVDTSTHTFVVGEEFDIEVDYNGAGDQNAYLFFGTPDATAGGQFRLAATAAADETMTGALTATNFSESNILNVTNTTGGHIHHVGYVSNLTDSAVPTPYVVPEAPGGEDDLGNMILSRLVAGVVTEYELLQRVAGAPVLLALDRKGVIGPDPEGTVSKLLVPSEGCWFGAETPIEMGVGSSLVGLQNWEGFSGGRTPDMLHFYTQAWNGQISPAQTAQRIRPGKPVPIMFHTTKIFAGASWAAIAAGTHDGQIDIMAAGLRQRTDRHFVGIWHEPEDNVAGGGNTAADFVAMWEHVVDRCVSQGVARAIDGGRTVWALIFMGYRDWGISGLIEDLLPDPTKYDWLGWDPYFFTSTRFTTTSKWLNDDQGGWPGMYARMMSIPAVAAKPFMTAEWGVNHWPATDGFSEAGEAARYAAMAADMESSFPNMKAIIHWHGQTVGGANRNYQLYGRPTAAAGFAQLAHQPYFNAARLVDIPAQGST